MDKKLQRNIIYTLVGALVVAFVWALIKRSKDEIALIPGASEVLEFFSPDLLMPESNDFDLKPYSFGDINVGGLSVPQQTGIEQGADYAPYNSCNCGTGAGRIEMVFNTSEIARISMPPPDVYIPTAEYVPPPCFRYGIDWDKFYSENKSGALFLYRASPERRARAVEAGYPDTPLGVVRHQYDTSSLLMGRGDYGFARNDGSYWVYHWHNGRPTEPWIKIGKIDEYETCLT